MLTGFARTAMHLYVARFLLGVAEAGYFPGILLYLTCWFRQRELGGTIAMFFTANAVANIIGAPVSGLILDHVHWAGAPSWRWLLILEGAPAILGGILTLRLPAEPAWGRGVSHIGGTVVAHDGTGGRGTTEAGTASHHRR